jgi:hypothetical protein
MIGTSWFTIEPIETSISRQKRQAVPLVQPTVAQTTAHPALHREHFIYEMLRNGYTFYNDTFIIRGNSR